MFNAIGPLQQQLTNWWVLRSVAVQYTCTYKNYKNICADRYVSKRALSEILCDHA